VDELRVFVHLLAATIWVGGQLVLAALVPALRAAGPDVPGAAARAFRRVAWPAFAVLLLTGVWNLAAIGDDSSDEQAVLIAKLAVVAISGATAYLHSHADTARARGLYGAATGVSAVLAVLLGVLLHD
jgi:putative copper export protein